MSRIFLRNWLRWRCRMQKNSLKFLAQPKTRGKNMKTPFLSSFCLSDFRTVLRFPPKNLVPEILNLLTLVVRNCTGGKKRYEACYIIQVTSMYSMLGRTKFKCRAKRGPIKENESKRKLSYVRICIFNVKVFNYPTQMLLMLARSPPEHPLV